MKTLYCDCPMYITAIKPMFIYYNLCLSLKLDRLSCSFTPISFLSNYQTAQEPQIDTPRQDSPPFLKSYEKMYRIFEKFWGISCEKSRFYPQKNLFFFNFRGARTGCAPWLWSGFILGVN